jgi:hypothetical protein
MPVIPWWSFRSFPHRPRRAIGSTPASNGSCRSLSRKLRLIDSRHLKRTGHDLSHHPDFRSGRGESGLRPRSNGNNGCL